jgi:hypothetical protein
MNSCPIYQYAPHRPGDHRGIAHWRGARGGMRVLSMPSCAAWLHRQANDPHYDFWPALAVGGHWTDDSPVPSPENSGPALSAQCVFVLQKEGDGNWLLAPLEAWPDRAVRPVAANSALALVNSANGVGSGTVAAAAGAQSTAAPAFIIEIS